MRIIIHVDMDAFFAAVEERRNPDLRGRPIVVGADPKEGKGRGVVATASYGAREFGIHSAMPISRAWRLADAARRRGAPATVFLRGDHDLYKEVSGRIMKILARGADALEEAGIDEAYIDVSSLGSFENAERHARVLKAEVMEREGLTCSIGIGPNRLVAKIASGFKKPDGLTVVPPAAAPAFLASLSIRAIPGIGPKTSAFLQARDIRTIADLRRLPEPQLVAWFGKWGHRLFQSACAIDESLVSSERLAKSVGHQETFERDTRSPSFAIDRLSAMAERTLARLRQEGFPSFRTVILTVRFEDFETKTRSRTFKTDITAGDGSEAFDRLKREALALLLPFLDARGNPESKAIRLIGLRLEKLGPAKATADAPRPSHLALVIFVGLPASGKSSFFQTYFATTHCHVSKDLLHNVKNRDQRQRELIAMALTRGQSVVVDNVNATLAERAPLIALGRAHGARIVGYYFDSRVRECLERNAGRVGRHRVPDVAIYAAAKRLEVPRYAEGFDRLHRTRMVGESGFEITEVPLKVETDPVPEAETASLRSPLHTSGKES